MHRSFVEHIYSLSTLMGQNLMKLVKRIQISWVFSPPCIDSLSWLFFGYIVLQSRSNRGYFVSFWWCYLMSICCVEIPAGINWNACLMSLTSRNFEEYLSVASHRMISRIKLYWYIISRQPLPSSATWVCHSSEGYKIVEFVGPSGEKYWWRFLLLESERCFTSSCNNNQTSTIEPC